jgi:hypothetical protein
MGSKSNFKGRILKLFKILNMYWPCLHSANYTALKTFKYLISDDTVCVFQHTKTSHKHKAFTHNGYQDKVISSNIIPYNITRIMAQYGTEPKNVLAFVAECAPLNCRWKESKVNFWKWGATQIGNTPSRFVFHEIHSQ